MRRLIVKAVLFSMPFLFWCGFVVAVDPFDYFNVSPLVDSELKEVTAKKLNTLLYNSIQFRNDPCPRVLIGDSRTARLTASLVSDITGEKWFNLNSNRAKLNEIVDLYWLVADQVQLQEVVIGLNFNMFNEYSYADRVPGVQSILKNPLLYVFDRSVASASFVVLRSWFSGEPGETHAPPMSPEDFWIWNVEVKARHHYGKWSHPDKALSQLKTMAEHARANDIALTFILVPHHQEFQDRVNDFALTTQKEEFEREVAALARTINFDYLNEWTTQRELFTDPIHMGPDLALRVAREVFEGPLRIGQELSVHRTLRTQRD